MTKHFELRYRTRAPDVRAIRWTEDTPMADLHDFADGLVRADDVLRSFAVYDTALHEWLPFKYGDWLVTDDTHLTTMTHGEFVRYYEEVPQWRAHMRT